MKFIKKFGFSHSQRLTLLNHLSTKWTEVKYSGFVYVASNCSSYKRVLFTPKAEGLIDKIISLVYEFIFLDNLKEKSRSELVCCKSRT